MGSTNNGIKPIISTNNSSTTNLAAGNSYTFTGTAEMVHTPDVMLNLYADQPTTIQMQFSTDGTNWDSTLTKLGTSGFNEFTTTVKGARYFRAVVTTDSLTTTEFRLQVEYGLFRQGNAPLNGTYGLDSDSLLVRPSLSWLDISRGLASGITTIKKFGRNNAVGTSYVPVALGGIYRTPQSGSATTLRIKAGGDANDTAAGSGARQVTLIGLDENFEEATETLATAGASASSATTTTFTRLFRCFVSQSGTYASATTGSHSGAITIENGAGGTDWATIGATSFPKSQSEIGAYTVPANTTGHVKLRDLSIDSGKTIDLVFFSRANADQTSAPYSAMRAQSVVSGVTGGSIETFGSVDVPFGPYVGPTDIGFMAKVSTGTASVSVEFEIFLIDEV